MRAALVALMAMTALLGGTQSPAFGDDPAAQFAPAAASSWVPPVCNQPVEFDPVRDPYECTYSGKQYGDWATRDPMPTGVWTTVRLDSKLPDCQDVSNDPSRPPCMVGVGQEPMPFAVIGPPGEFNPDFSGMYTEDDEICGTTDPDTSCVYATLADGVGRTQIVLTGSFGVYNIPEGDLDGFTGMKVCETREVEGSEKRLCRATFWHSKVIYVDGTGPTDDDILDLQLESTPASESGYFSVRLTLTNTGTDRVTGITFTDPGGLGFSARGYPKDERGELATAGFPDDPPPTSLDPGESSEQVYDFEEITPGRMAIYAEATGRVAGRSTSVSQTLLRNNDPEAIADFVTGQFLAMGAMDTYTVQLMREAMLDQAREAKRVRNWARKQLSPAQRKIWLGSRRQIKVSPFEQAFADRANVAPELAAVMLPDRSKAPKRLRSDVPTTGQIAKAFFAGWTKQTLAIGKQRLGEAWHKGKKSVRNGWLQSVGMINYLNGDASPEERAQVEALAVSAWNNDITKQGWLENSARRGLLSNVPMANAYFDHPLADVTKDDLKQIYSDVTFNSEDLGAQLAQEKVKLANIYKGDNFLKNVRRHGEMTADISYPVVEMGAQTLVGGATEKVVGATVRKAATGVVRIGKATGVLTEEGRLSKAGSIIENDPIGATGARPSARDLALRSQAGDPSETLEELENIGGIPLREAEIQREIVGEIETDLGLEAGTIGLGLKKSSPLRKPNSVAKFELAKVKTGKPIHTQVGLAEQALSEPSFFKPTDPKKLPEWKLMPQAQRDKLVKTYKEAAKEWADWTSGAPTNPDLAKLSKATQRVGGPEITEPVSIDMGQGRTVRAIFEESPVPGTDTIRIRAKYYEVDGIVFLDSPKARPMGPDLDGVAIYDAKKEARFADRQLESKVVREYRRKVAERVGSGERFHGAEHGLTLIMDDVAAGPKGNVGFLMQYGIPYLPYHVAYRFARRIEPYIEMLAEEMVGQVSDFNQPLVIVKSTEVYYGRLPLSEW